jgi:hypothetical protein
MPSTAKLPFWRTLGQAYAAVFGNLGILFRIAGPWLLIIAPAYVAYLWLDYPTLVSIRTAARAGLVYQNTVENWILGAISWLALLVPVSALAVSWHRHLLLNETAPKGFRFDGIVKRYAVVALIIGLFFYVPSLLIQAFTSFRGSLGQVFQLALKVLSLVALYASCRISIALPAVAVEGTLSTLSEAWSATRRNGWRLFFGSFLAVSESKSVAAVPA